VGLSRGLTTARKGWRTVRKDVVHLSYRRGEARGNGHERGLHDATVMLRRLDRFNGTGR
jgi:hypothetical protein